MLVKKTPNVYRSRELEQQIEESLLEIKKEALQDISMAAENPEVNPELVISETEAAIEELKAKVRQWFQPKGQKLQAMLEKYKLDKVRDEVAQNRGSIKRKLQNLDIDLKRIKLDYPWHLLWIPIVAILAICGTDAAVNYAAIQVLVPNLLVSIIVALLTLASLALAAHAIGGKIREAKSKQQKWMWFISGMAGGAIIFYVLGLIRESYYGSGDSWMGSPELWTVWNSFFYAVAIFISSRYLPSKAQWRQRGKWQNIKKEIDDLHKQDRAEAAKLDKAEQEQANILQELNQLQSYQEDTLNRLDRQRDLLRVQLIKEHQLKGGQPFEPKATHTLKSPK